MNVPSLTIDLIDQLKELYPDRLDTDPKNVGTPQYWMDAGIVDLIRRLEHNTKPTTFKEV